ncbi:MAG: CatB-related O-acetyltransferase [Phenylobacterium sp.]
MRTLDVTQPLLELLWDRRVFHNLQSERWRVGDRLRMDADCALEPFTQILVGSVLPKAIGCFSYSSSEFGSGLQVGRYCSIARGVTWLGGNHPTDWATTSPVFYEHNSLAIGAYRKIHGLTAPPMTFEIPPHGVTIGHDVWIGEEAAIARGVTIGDGAVIGARALVLKDVPPYAIVGGAPAKILRMRFPEPLIERFRRAQWWRFGPEVLETLPVDQPERFLDALEARIAADPPDELRPAPLRAEEILRVLRGA